MVNRLYMDKPEAGRTWGMILPRAARLGGTDLSLLISWESSPIRTGGRTIRTASDHNERGAV